MSDITDLLKAWNKGDRESLNRVIPLVDRELRRIAHGYMCNEKPEHILQTTALVHEALIRLLKENVRWENRRQFYAIVARRMRQVLIRYAEGEPQIDHVNIEDAIIVDEKKSKELLLLHAALRKFETKYQRPALVVECRYFIGMTVKEIAALLHVSRVTVERDWESARAWLKREMTGEFANE